MRNRRSILKGIGATAIGLTILDDAAAVGAVEGNSLNFYNWDTYIGETTLDDFRAISGINVQMDIFDTNDTLFSKLKTTSQYDVIVPSHDYVERMIAANMLLPLDHSLLPNFKNIGPKFRNPVYDPGCAYSVPYTTLTLGIGYRKSKVQTRPSSWKVLFDSSEYSDRIALLSDVDILFQLCAKYLGISPRDIRESDIARIESMLLRQKPFLKKFHDDDGQDMLARGEVDLVLEYNGDIANLVEEDDDIDFVIPDEGSLMMLDCFCIPKNCRRPKNAHRFINYLLSGIAGKHISETILYPTPNYAARALMPAEYKQNPILFPPPERSALLEMHCYLPEFEKKFEAAYERLRQP